MSEAQEIESPRRLELGAFLRQKRLALRPEDVGLSPGGRRHVKGLRREEVALLSGIGTSWYAMLEQGRVKTLGERTLIGIAEALRLSLAEREYLYDLARSLAAFSRGDLPEVPAAILEFVERSTGSAVFLLTDRFDVLTWNQRADELFAFSSMTQTRNLLENMLFNDEMAPRFMHLDETLRNMVGLLRANYARLGNAEFDEFIRSLRARSGRFRAMWDTRDVELAPETECHIVHPLLGDVVMNLVAFTPMASPQHMLITLTEVTSAADEAVAP